MTDVAIVHVLRPVPSSFPPPSFPSARDAYLNASTYVHVRGTPSYFVLVVHHLRRTFYGPPAPLKNDRELFTQVFCCISFVVEKIYYWKCKNLFSKNVVTNEEYFSAFLRSRFPYLAKHIIYLIHIAFKENEDIIHYKKSLCKFTTIIGGNIETNY